MQCFECDGEYEKKVIVYECETYYGKLIVPDVEAEVCNKCGDDILSSESCSKIDDAAIKLRKTNYERLL
jgi:hypothetical protein